MGRIERKFNKAGYFIKVKADGLFLSILFTAFNEISKFEQTIEVINVAEEENMILSSSPSRVVNDDNLSLAGKKVPVAIANTEKIGTFSDEFNKLLCKTRDENAKKKFKK